MKNLFLKFGVIYGIVSIISVLAFYHGIIGIGLNSLVGIASLFVIFWLASRELKSKNEGYATFGELFKLFFLITIIGIVISIVFTMIYNNLISDDLKDAIVERYFESQISMYKMLGMDEDMMVTIEDGLRENMTPDKFFGFSNTLFGMFFSFFIYMIFALIGGAIFKRVPKEM